MKIWKHLLICLFNLSIFFIIFFFQLLIMIILSAFHLSLFDLFCFHFFTLCILTNCSSNLSFLIIHCLFFLNLHHLYLKRLLATIIMLPVHLIKTTTTTTILQVLTLKFLFNLVLAIHLIKSSSICRSYSVKGKHQAVTVYVRLEGHGG